jgi:uncharacterized membrane protein YdcZ (DUF606 family)
VKKGVKYGLIAAGAMFVNLMVGPMGLFAYWGWPDFPNWLTAERILYWIVAQGLVGLTFVLTSTFPGWDD